MQNESPVAYASTGYQKQKQDMCKSRERERERVTGHSVGCSHFKAYLYGQDIVYVKTDHKPLKAIVLKLLNSAPKRLQRMSLQLQKYNQEVKYKKRQLIYMADTLTA